MGSKTEAQIERMAFNLALGLAFALFLFILGIILLITKQYDGGLQLFSIGSFGLICIYFGKQYLKRWEQEVQEDNRIINFSRAANFEKILDSLRGQWIEKNDNSI